MTADVFLFLYNEISKIKANVVVSECVVTVAY